jgi:gliding motility-associated-like protein
MRRIIRGQAFYRVLLFILCFGLSFYYEAQGQVSGTYTINSAVATGGTNFHSFADAVAFMQNGLNGPIVFNVKAGSGPYNEQVYLNNKIGTTATNTLTFNCNGVTLTFLSTDANQRAGVKLDNISYVTVNNLNIVTQAANDGEYGYGFHLLNNSDNNVIQNCTITGTMNYDIPESSEGIVINGNNGFSMDPGTSYCDNNVIQNNTISVFGNGITLNSTPVSGNATLMLGNKILNNTISDCFYACIQLHYNDGTLVNGNDLQGGPDAYQDIRGIYMNTFDQNVKITNNQIHNFQIPDGVDGTFIYGILNTAYAAAGNVNLIANNLIYNFASNGPHYGIATRYGSSSYLNVYHNTISLDDQTVVGQSCDGLYFQDGNDINVWDNIVTVSRKSNDWNRAISFNNVIRVTSNRNVFNVSNVYGPGGIGFYNGTAIDVLSQWQKRSGLDYHSVMADPQYTNLAAFQFKPKSQVIDNMGAYVNINTDITGASRSTVSPDPGCYEFTSAPCSTPMTAGKVLVVTDTVLCLASSSPSIALNVTTGTWGSGQTYKWQSSSTPTGTYSDISSSLPWPALDQTLTAGTFYYRVVATCGATTDTTKPVRVIVNTQLPAGTYTINSTQPTGGINFNSFGDAVLAMQCGITGSVVFNVAPNTGPYNEQVIIPVINTSPTQTITFNGNGDTVAFAATKPGERAVIKLNGTDYVTIDSLNIVQKGTSLGYGIEMLNDADNNTVKRCTILVDKTTKITDFAGIVINPSASDPQAVNVPSLCDSNTIAKNTIIGGYMGISCTSGIGTASTGNTFINNSIKDSYAYGIFLDGAITNVLVDSNDVSQPTRKTVSSYSGIYVRATTNPGPTAVTISRNRIHDLLKNRMDTAVEIHGIDINRVPGSSATPLMVVNNLMYSFYGLGYQYALYTIGSNYVRFYHNTVSLEDSLAKVTNSTVVACGFGSFYTGSPTTTGVEFKNNSVVVKRAGTGVSAGVYINSNDGPLVSNNNNFLMVASQGSTYTGFMNGTTYPLLSDWVKTGKDSNSIALDPLYYDPVHGDFTPTYLPFDNKGTPVGVPIDIIDVTRSTTKPDIGAYEFTICYPLNTPVLKLDSVGVYTLRFSWTPVTNTTGYLVSRDGINWSIPSSGPMGTTHTIAGLKARDTVGLIVKALGTRWDCTPVYSNRLTGQTITDQIFIPNTFTPNGNGQNDVFKVYSNIIQSMHLMVFNQWGEKVFETTDPGTGWDGTYKGKPQPVGVYVYVAYMVLSDQTNSTVTKKGTFNLIR